MSKAEQSYEEKIQSLKRSMEDYQKEFKEIIFESKKSNKYDYDQSQLKISQGVNLFANDVKNI